MTYDPAVGELRRERGTGGTPRWLDDSNRWQARYTTPDGRRKAVYSTIPGPKGERACAKKRDDVLEALAAGSDPTMQPLADYLAWWLARRTDLAPESKRRYERLLPHVVQAQSKDPKGKRIAAKPLMRISTDDIEDLYAEIGRGMAPKGIELLHTSLVRPALQQALLRGKVVRNAADGASRPKVRHVTPDVYDDAQLRRLLDVAEGHPLEGLIALLGTTSLRHGELLDLRWHDIDLEHGRIVLANPEKGGHARTIPMTRRAVRMLRAHRARQLEQRLSRAGAWEDRDLVFPNHWGAKGDASWNRAQLRTLTAANDLPPVTPRNLRHAVITSLVRNNVPMKIAQELAGHQTMKQTADTYAHVDPGMLAVARDALERVVGE